MTLDEVLEQAKNGGVLFIEQEMGAEDGLAYAEKALEGYRIYKAAPDNSSASVFEKAMPKYADLFRIKTPPKVIASYFISKDGMMMTNYERKEIEMDSDIFSSMLSAVGNFVQDSFSQMSGKEETDALDILGIHNKTIKMSKGDYGVMALVYEGTVSEEANKDLEELNKRVQEKHASELEKWNGTMNTPWLVEIQNSMKNFFFDSKRYEGELDLESLNTAKYSIKNKVIDSIIGESKSGKIAFLFDDAQNMSNFSIELIESIAREADIPIICQYETGVLDDGLKNEELKKLEENLKKENKVYHTSLKSDMDIEALVATKLASIDESAFEMLRYAAVAGEFDTGVLSAALVIDKELVEETGKKFAEIGILKGNRLANSRMAQRALESIPAHRRGQVDIAVANALAKKGDNYAPKIAELYLHYAETNEEYREKAVEFSIKAAEQFLQANNLETSLGHYINAIITDNNNERKIRTLKNVLDLELISTKFDEMIEHANELEKIADETQDLHSKGFAAWSRAKAYGSVIKKEFDLALKEAETAKRIFVEIGDEENVTSVLMTQGVINLNKGDYDQALVFYQQAMDYANVNLNTKAKIGYNMGSIYRLKREGAKAEDMINEALELNKQLGNELQEGICLKELAQIYYGVGDFNKTITFGKKALNICLQKNALVYLADTYNIIGAAYLDMNQHEESMEILNKGLKIAIQLKDDRCLEPLYVNLMELHHKEETKAVNDFLGIMRQTGKSKILLAHIIGLLKQDNKLLEELKKISGK